MSPPTQSNLSHSFNGAVPKNVLINNELFQNRNLIGGLMSPPYGLSRIHPTVSPARVLDLWAKGVVRFCGPVALFVGFPISRKVK